MNKTLKLLIVDDHEIILDSLYLLFNMMESVVEVHKESDSRKVVDFLKKNEIDVLVTDYKMPHINGLQLIHLVRNTYPTIKILVLSVNEDSAEIKNAYHAGALGYIMKKANRYELEKAVLTVSEGRKYFGQNAMSAMLSDSTIEDKNKAVPTERVEKLTKRELEIIKLLSEELSSSEIGALLFISTGTVETHRHNILRKLEMKSTIGVVKFAMKAGII